MADENKFADEVMSEEELDNVAGGSWVEFTADMLDAQKRGIPGFENLTDNNLDLIKMIGDDKLRHQYVDKIANVFASHGITMEYKGKFWDKNIFIPIKAKKSLANKLGISLTANSFGGDNMADENKFADEVMSDEELEQVAGGGNILVKDPLEINSVDYEYQQILDTIQKNKS